MISSQVADIIAADRLAERQRSAQAARLAAIARCCQPSTWTRAARRVVRAAARLRLTRSATATCCA